MQTDMFAPGVDFASILVALGLDLALPGTFRPPGATLGGPWAFPGRSRGGPRGSLGALLALLGRSLALLEGVWAPFGPQGAPRAARGGQKPQKVMTLIGIVQSDSKKVMTLTGMEDPRRSDLAFWPLRSKKVSTVARLEHAKCSELQFWRGRFSHPY